LYSHANADEAPFQKELCGQRGDGQIEPFDPQARQAENDADAGSRTSPRSEHHE
jgi:hypothetical protein